mgnify:CR=1 FL=1
MAANFIDAVQAYRKATEMPKESAGIGIAGAPSGNSFDNVLQQVSGDLIDSLKAAEHATKMGVLGKMSPVDIATAVAGAEVSLQMMAVLRDKFINAYQEITRMSV